MKILFVIIIMTLLVCLLQVDEMKQKQTKEVKQSRIYINDVDAFNLACLDSGKILQKEDKVIGYYASTMNDLQKKVKNSRKEISDIVVKCQEILYQNNIKLNLYKILCDLNKSMPDEVTGLELKEVAAAYITLTIK